VNSGSHCILLLVILYLNSRAETDISNTYVGAIFFSLESCIISALLLSGGLTCLIELILTMISNASYFQKLNKSQEVVKEGSAKVVVQFRIGVIPHFRWVKIFLVKSHNEVKVIGETQVCSTYRGLVLIKKKR
jgi:hypothetical protein